MISAPYLITAGGSEVGAFGPARQRSVYIGMDEAEARERESSLDFTVALNLLR
jgi:hypothetical protein